MHDRAAPEMTPPTAGGKDCKLREVEKRKIYALKTVEAKKKTNECT